MLKKNKNKIRKRNNAVIEVANRASVTLINFAGYDFYLDFPIRQMGQYSKVNAAGQKPIEAFTICVWLKTSDQHQIGLLRYFDNGFNDRIALSIQPGDGRLLFTILDEDR